MPRVVLRFPNNVEERDFRAAYRNNTLGQIQISIFLGISLFGSFVFLDIAIVTGDIFEYQRFLEVSPGLLEARLWVVAVGIALFVYSKTNEPKHFFFSCAAGIFVAALMILEMVDVMEELDIAPEYTYAYYHGILLVIIYGQLAVRLMFLFSWSLGAIILVVMLFWPDHKSHDALFWNSYFHVLGAFVIGSYGSYWMERYARENHIMLRARRLTLSLPLVAEIEMRLDGEKRSFLKEVTRLVEEGLKNNASGFGVSALADQMKPARSPRSLQKEFKEILDTTPKDFIEYIRDNLAIEHFKICRKRKEIYQTWGYYHKKRPRINEKIEEFQRSEKKQ